MENPERILIIILAVTLTIFLLVMILAIIKIIQVLNHVRVITEKAERLANSAESVGELLKNSAGPIAIAKLIANISQVVFNRRKKAKGKV